MFTKAKGDLEVCLKDAQNELDWFKKRANEEEDNKAKLEQLRKSGVIDDNYDPV